MKCVSTEQMRELDRLTIESFDVPGEVLMERAGNAVADIVDELATLAGIRSAPVGILAGKGNNGGDAFVVARHLIESGFDVEVLLAGTSNSVRGDAFIHLNRLRAEGADVHELPRREDWDHFPPPPIGGIVVDGLLGTGISGAPRGAVAGAIELVNRAGADNLVVSIDIPSGLNSDTGEAAGHAVMADVTVTMGYAKKGLMTPAALEYVGVVEVADIGIPPELVESVECELELNVAEDIYGVLPRRARNSHKGSYGHLLIVSGSPGYSGAAVLSASAALRSGVGLVTVLTPASVACTVATACPEAMVHPAEESEEGLVADNAMSRWGRSPGDFDAILVGPGLGTGASTKSFVERLLRESPVPVILDADAINVCAGRTDLIKQAAGPVILTPHPGELGRLLGCETGDVQSDRLARAQQATTATGGVVVLKGAGTLIVAPGRTPTLNLNGNPGMATGGTGDVLAGLLAGLCAQAVTPFDAARTAVYLHGRAGDLAAWRTSQAGLTAASLVERLPSAFRDIGIR